MHLHERGIQKVALKLLGLERGAHDHELEVRPCLQNLRSGITVSASE